jgi:hypothetical protein
MYGGTLPNEYRAKTTGSWFELSCRYDVDKSGSLSQAEFESFLKDLAHSRILDPLVSEGVRQ